MKLATESNEKKEDMQLWLKDVIICFKTNDKWTVRCKSFQRKKERRRRRWHSDEGRKLDLFNLFQQYLLRGLIYHHPTRALLAISGSAPLLDRVRHRRVWELLLHMNGRLRHHRTGSNNPYAMCTLTSSPQSRFRDLVYKKCAGWTARHATSRLCGEGLKLHETNCIWFIFSPVPMIGKPHHGRSNTRVVWHSHKGKERCRRCFPKRGPWSIQKLQIRSVALLLRNFRPVCVLL